jgi:hypothetical protein
MALVGNDYLTLKDMYAQTEGGKVTSTIIDIFMNTNVLLEDAIAVECNDGSSHKTTVRNGLPEVEFRKFYQGIAPSKGDYTQVSDKTAMLEAYSVVDKKLADLNGNTPQFRLNEAEAFVQAMNDKVQTNIFYGNQGVNDASFDGLATRYNKISTDKDSIGYQVINGGGTGNNNTSVWFITWGDKQTHLIYPKGSKAGLEHTDQGEQTVTAPDGKGMMQAYRDHFSWDVGLSLRNFKATARIANIDVTKLGTDNAANLIDLMIDGYYRVKKAANGGKTVIYVNEKIGTFLHKQALAKNNVNLTFGEYAGAPIVNFLGLPVKVCDQIINNEEQVK